MRKKLGLNIDHVATVRQARRACYPDPLYAAMLAEQAGVDGITIHLREDRRHIQDRDVYAIKEAVQVNLNLEMAIHPEVVAIALQVKPQEVCIVPEKRQEITTEGGLDVVSQKMELQDVVKRLSQNGTDVSLFIDADKHQIEAAKEIGAPTIEIHTGQYAEAQDPSLQQRELEKILGAAEFGRSLGLRVNAGHGLNYQNTYDIACIAQLDTLNIGHAIIARAIYVGLEKAIRDMQDILNRAAMDHPL